MSRENLERCFRLCAQRAWRLACALVGDAHAASDCVQQAFAVAARKPAGVPRDDPWPWFSTVLFHEIRNHRRKRRPGHMPEEFDMQGQTPDPAATAQRHETEGELRLALDTLPEPERDAITLTYIGGLTHVQAAQVMNMPAKTLSSHVSRGLERLRKRLNHKEETLLSSLAALPLLTPPGGWESALAAWQGAAVGSAVPGAVAIVGGTIMAKKAMVAAALVLALLVGFGGGLLTEHHTATRWQQLAAAQPDASPGEATGQGVTPDPAGRTTRAESNDAAAATRAATDMPMAATTQRFSDWLGAIGAEKPTAGERRVSGRATGPDGEPLPGVTITLEVIYPDEKRDIENLYIFDNDNDSDEQAGIIRRRQAEMRQGRYSLEQLVEAQARKLAFLLGGRHQASTNAEGKYEFANLGLYEYEIRAEKPGYALKGWGDLHWGGRRTRPDARVDFTARAMRELELDVRLPGGSAPDVAQVVDEKFAGLRTWFPDFPVVALELSVTTIRVYAGRHQEFLSDPIPVAATFGRQRMTLQLKPSPGIVCVVKMPPAPPNVPVQDYSVCLQANPPGEPPTGRPAGPGLWLKSIYAPRYEASYPRQKPGRYRVYLITDHTLEAWKDVEIKSEGVVVALEPPPPDKKDYIIVRVNGPDGATAAGANVRAEMIRGEMQAGDCKVKPMPDGTHWVERVPMPDDETRELQYSVKVNLANYGTTSVLHPFDGPGELTINLQAPATLTVLFPGAGSHPAKARLHTRLMHVLPGWSFGVSPRDMQGPFSGLATDKLVYGPMPPGSYRFTLRFAGERDTSEGVQLLALDIELPSGEHSRTVELPALHTLTLLVPDTTAIRELNVERPDGTGRHWIGRERMSDRVSLEGVMAGEWIIRYGDNAMRVTVRGDMTVPVELRPFDCRIIGKLKPGGQIEAMGLQSGDRVVRVDGQGGETAEDIRKLMNGGYARESTTWTVLRAGAPVEVAFNGKALLAILRATGPNREALYDRPGLRE